MARSINMVIILGNLGADPEVRSTPNGAQVANFRVACTEQWKDGNGQKQERTEWVTCVAWRGLADIAGKFLHKGSRVHVIGKLQTRSWDDKQSGAKRYATEVLVDDLVMLDGAPAGGNQSGYSSNSGSQGGAPARGTGADEYPDFSGPGSNVQPGSADDDLPFN